MEVQVNYLAVFFAAVASMVVGFIYYSPSVFGTAWMKEMGLSADKLKSSQKEMGKLYGLSFVVALITAYVLTHVMTFAMSYLGTSELTTALNTAFWMWLGFVAPVQLTDQIFGKKNWRLFAINTGYQLVALIVMAVTIAWL